MNRFIQITFVLLLSVFQFSGLQAAKSKRDYSIMKIPPQLLVNANSVMRYYNETVERTSLKSSVKKVVYAVTVLNAAGNQSGYFAQPYFKYSHVGNISATIFDAKGKKVKKVTTDEIMDIAIESAVTLYSDSRAKVISPDYFDYPFTVEYSFSITSKSSLNMDRWQVYPTINMSIEQEDFTMITPEDDPGLGVYYYLNDTSLKIDIEHLEGKTYYHLHVENLPPVRSEKFSENLADRTPVVRFAPVSFSVGGFTGSYKSWVDYGNFICDLNEGRAVLPKQTEQMVKALSARLKDDREVMDSLYKFMQDKVRYVSVQKGLGGWQPFEAKMVDKLSYGDCKALTNYMKSLLLAANIDAKYTLVRAGQNASGVVVDFPSNQFNHAILCVPLNGDTVWLECTSQHIPSGYLGSFTDDRYVLVVEKDGSKIVRTPAEDENINTKIRVTEVTLNTDGNCVVDVNTHNRGIFYDKNYKLYSDTHAHQKKALLDRLRFSTVSLKDFTVSESFDPVPEILYRIQVEIPRYATHSGNRLFFAPFLFSKEENYKFKQKERQNAISVRRNVSYNDTVVFHLPEGYIAGKLTPLKSCSSKYGTYSAAFRIENNDLIYTRRFVMYKGTFPASEYHEFVAFFNKVRKYDQTKVVLMKAGK
jgi:transglutaminase-like putative cysteine protease